MITPHIAKRIEQYTKQQPGLYSWEIRDRLVQDNIWRRENVPSLRSISRLLNNNDKLKTMPELRKQQTSRNSYLIASILDLPSKGRESSSRSSGSSRVSSSSSLDSNAGRLEGLKLTG